MGNKVPQNQVGQKQISEMEKEPIEQHLQQY